jgi:glutaredoxin
MFHNGSGPMCLEAIDFLEENDIEYTEYLTTDENFEERLEEYKEEYGETSEGVSNSYGYYPMIFYKGRSFSGFNDEIATILENL